MDFIRQHISGLLAGGGGVTAVLVVAFKDSFKEWLADWKAERAAARSERMAAFGKGDQMSAQLVSVLREDLKERRDHENRVVMVLEGVKNLLTQIESKQSAQGLQLDLMHQRVIIVQGAVGRVQ